MGDRARGIGPADRDVDVTSAAPLWLKPHL